MIDRTQKKCLIGSAMLHGLLVVIMLFGMAFSKKDDPPAPFINIELPTKFTVTDGPTHGGTPMAAPPAPKQAAPPQQQSAPPQKVVQTPPVQPKPQPPPEPAKQVETHMSHDEIPVKKSADIFVHSAPRKQKTKVDLTLTTRTSSSSKSKTSKSDAKHQISHDQETDESDARAVQAARNAIRGAVGNISAHGAGTTSVELSNNGTGGSGGGEAFVNYGQMIGRIYQTHYNQELARAGDVAERVDTVDVTVTIARSGKVVGFQVNQKSGNATLDRMVRRVLDQVRSVLPFPEGAKDEQRDFNITFELKPKRQIG